MRAMPAVKAVRAVVTGRVQGEPRARSGQNDNAQGQAERSASTSASAATGKSDIAGPSMGGRPRTNERTSDEDGRTASEEGVRGREPSGPARGPGQDRGAPTKPTQTAARAGAERAAAGRQGDVAPERRLPDVARPQVDKGGQPASSAESLAGWRQYAAQSLEAPAAAAGGLARQAVARAQAEIVREARYLGRNGSSEITVRLHPPEMGRMKVVVQMREGKLDVRIRVEDPQVREAIRAEVQNLDRNLREAHLEPARLEVTDYQAGGRDSRQAPMSDGGPSPENGAVQAGSGEEAPGGHGWAIFSGTGGVDCLV